jgi:replicative DNA helicase
MEFFDYISNQIHNRKLKDRDKVIQNVNKTVEDAIKLYEIEKSYKKLIELANAQEDGTCDSIKERHEKLMELQDTAKQILKNIDNKTVDSLTNKSTFDTETDIDKVANDISDMYRKNNRTPTGFEELDKLLDGGFQRESLYIIGGTAGSGKSTLMIQSMLNASLYKYYLKGDLTDKKKLFIYITLEISNTLVNQRMICCFNDITPIQLQRMNKDPIINFVESLNKSNSIIDVNFVQPYITNNNHIISIIEKTIEKYGGKDKVVLAGVYVDYLELLGNSRKEKDNTYTNQGEITQQLKDIAVEFKIPVITATQLNRDAYNVENSFGLINSKMGDSMKKVHVADAVFLMAKSTENSSIVHFRCSKNRNGDVGVPLDFNVVFSKYKFKECFKSSKKSSNKNENKELIPVDESKATFKFEGGSF